MIKLRVVNFAGNFEKSSFSADVTKVQNAGLPMVWSHTDKSIFEDKGNCGSWFGAPPQSSLSHVVLISSIKAISSGISLKNIRRSIAL